MTTDFHIYEIDAFGFGVEAFAGMVIKIDDLKRFLNHLLEKKPLPVPDFINQFVIQSVDLNAKVGQFESLVTLESMETPTHRFTFHQHGFSVMETGDDKPTLIVVRMRRSELTAAADSLKFALEFFPHPVKFNHVAQVPTYGKAYLFILGTGSSGRLPDETVQALYRSALAIGQP